MDLGSRKVLISSHNFGLILIFTSQIVELFKTKFSGKCPNLPYYCFSNFTIINFLVSPTSFRYFVPHANLWRFCEVYKSTVRSWERMAPHQNVKVFQQIDLFSLYVLFSHHFRPGDGTPRNCLFQMLSLYIHVHTCAYVLNCKHNLRKN